MATPKRSHRLPHGEGSFYFRESKQLWVGVIEAGWTERGTRRRITVTSADEDTAWDKLRDARKKIDLGQSVGATPTLKAWSTTYLERVVETLRRSPYRATASYIRKWIIRHSATRSWTSCSPPTCGPWPRRATTAAWRNRPRRR